jgi:two-component system response regulator NreC
MAVHLHLTGLDAGRPPFREGSRITVIVADDHHAVRRNVRFLLELEADLTVIGEAADLSTAVRHVSARLPHVLVLDLRMPDGSSTEVIGELRAAVPETEIVVLTMEASGAFAHQAIRAGAIGFVLKDRADVELPEAVRQAARGEEYVSPHVTAALKAVRKARLRCRMAGV